jgi:hypothetical protein
MVATLADVKRFYSTEDVMATISRLSRICVNPRAVQQSPIFGDCGRTAYHVIAESAPTGRTLTLCTDGYMYHV